MSHKKTSRLDHPPTNSGPSAAPAERLQLSLVTVADEAERLRVASRRRRRVTELERLRREAVFLTAAPPGKSGGTLH